MISSLRSLSQLVTSNRINQRFIHRITAIRLLNKRMIEIQATPWLGAGDAEGEVALKGIEVAVIVEQLVPLGDTKCRDQRVDRIADGHADRPQRAEVLRGGNCDLTAGQRPKFEGRQQPLRAA